MHGYRADVAFDGEQRLPGGALVLVDERRIVASSRLRHPPHPTAARSPTAAALLPGLIDTHVHLCGDSSPHALDQIPELSADELEAVIAAALEQHLRRGRHGGARPRRPPVGRRRAPPAADDGPTVVASGPPLTSPGGHCWAMGGEATGTGALRAAVRERVERGADVVKIMASGGVMTPGTDMLAVPVHPRRAAGRGGRGPPPRAPGDGARPRAARGGSALDAGVDGIEHCSCLTRGGRPPAPGPGRSAGGLAGPRLPHARARPRRGPATARAGPAGGDRDDVRGPPRPRRCSCSRPAWRCSPAPTPGSARPSGTGWCRWRSPTWSRCGVPRRRRADGGDRPRRPGVRAPAAHGTAGGRPRRRPPAGRRRPAGRRHRAAATPGRGVPRPPGAARPG